MNSTNELPNFLIGGGVAAGTSFLSAMLSYHTDIYLPRVQRPEPNFFHYSQRFARGVEWYRDTWFSGVDGERAVGERSSLLLTSSAAPERLKQVLPEVKLDFCLRNPVERAWGNYRFSVLEGFEDLSFIDAIKAEQRRVSREANEWAEVRPHAYVERSRYSAHLERYLTTFGSENVLALKSEDLARRPHDVVREVCQFLEVDPTQPLPLPPAYSSPSVIDRQTQIELRRYFGERFSEIVELIRKEGDVSTHATSSEDVLNLSRLRANLRGGKDPMPDDSRRHLRNLLADDIVRVGRLVDFSVDDWD